MHGISFAWMTCHVFFKDLMPCLWIHLLGTWFEEDICDLRPLWTLFHALFRGHCTWRCHMYFLLRIHLIDTLFWGDAHLKEIACTHIYACCWGHRTLGAFLHIYLLEKDVSPCRDAYPLLEGFTWSLHSLPCHWWGCFTLEEIWVVPKPRSRFTLHNLRTS